MCWAVSLLFILGEIVLNVSIGINNTTPFDLILTPVQASCSKDGWFGTNCKYMCHCNNSAPCDKSDGSCKTGCASGWFGPACQYGMVMLNLKQYFWLVDNDDGTCNDRKNSYITVPLSPSVPLTWIRIVVRDKDQIKLSCVADGKSKECNLTARVDDKTKDLYCTVSHLAYQLKLSGKGIRGLCSLYVSAGRNVALKQETNQSKKQQWGDAKKAVDGTEANQTLSSVQATCTQTDSLDSPDWWTVNFTHPALVTKFIIYNRVDCCQNRLKGFKLNAYSQFSPPEVYSYIDEEKTIQTIYTVVPSPKIAFPVTQVRIEAASSTNILTLCEVFVYGENHCLPSKFGLACELPCNCAEGDYCFPHSGGCPGGCAGNFSGGNCSVCAAGYYGEDCQSLCSPSCGGDKSCNIVGGTCNHGCAAGYTGELCVARCPVGTYGEKCSNRCSKNCGDIEMSCESVSGNCSFCASGYYGANCSYMCSSRCYGPENLCAQSSGACDACLPGFYGDKCETPCSNRCAGTHNECDHVDGSCMECEPGSYGSNCTSDCSLNCVGQNHLCNIVDGACSGGCVEGYIGRHCEEPIDAETSSFVYNPFVWLGIGILFALLVSIIVPVLLINRASQSSQDLEPSNVDRPSRTIFKKKSTHAFSSPSSISSPSTGEEFGFDQSDSEEDESSSGSESDSNNSEEKDKTARAQSRPSIV